MQAELLRDAGLDRGVLVRRQQYYKLQEGGMRSKCLLGLVLGFTGTMVLLGHRRFRRFSRQEFSELNHEVRNALEVLTYAPLTCSLRDNQRCPLQESGFAEALLRIERALLLVSQVQQWADRGILA